MVVELNFMKTKNVTYFLVTNYSIISSAFNVFTRGNIYIHNRNSFNTMLKVMSRI